MAAEGPAEKAALRDRMRRVREGIPAEERGRRSREAQDRVLSLEELQGARSVLLFYAFGSEVQTRDLRGRLGARGARVLLPYLGSEGMEAAQAHDLVPSPYGPKEPSHRVPVDPSEVDLVIAPGLAFDRRGHRLGFGGGHYDRYLARLGEGALRVGMCFAEQVLESVPSEPHDVRMHLLVTDAEVIDCRP